MFHRFFITSRNGIIPTMELAKRLDRTRADAVQLGRYIGWALTSFYPETPSLAFRGVEIKKRRFLSLAKSNTYVFDFGSKSIYCISAHQKLCFC